VIYLQVVHLFHQLPKHFSYFFVIILPDKVLANRVIELLGWRLVPHKTVGGMRRLMVRFGLRSARTHREPSLQSGDLLDDLFALQLNDMVFLGFLDHR